MNSFIRSLSRIFFEKSHLDLLAETFSTVAAAELVIVARYLLMLQQSLGRYHLLMMILKIPSDFLDFYLSILEFSLTHLAFGFMFDFFQGFCLQCFLILQIFDLTTKQNLNLPLAAASQPLLLRLLLHQCHFHHHLGARPCPGFHWQAPQ